MSKEEFEDTKGVIRIRNSKDRKHNGQKKKDKRTHNDLQNMWFSDSEVIPAPLVAPVLLQL
jgi:hypothetical protein